jgi:CheY-like chemotaxis protein
MQTARGSSGLGIGLSLTKRLVELHGGSIWVESEGLGKGSDFIVVLPPGRRSVETLSASRVAITSNEERNTGMRTFNILVVDDNRAAAGGLRKLLEYSGHTVSVAYDGEDAIEKMKESGAEVVLLDIGLPGGMDGYSLARHLRHTQDEKLILIALTGYGQDEDKAQAFEAGFNYHLTKPVGIADIVAILAELKNVE